MAAVVWTCLLGVQAAGAAAVPDPLVAFGLTVLFQWTMLLLVIWIIQAWPGGRAGLPTAARRS